MKRPLLTILAVVLCGFHPLHGRIGDTEAQITERYGQPAESHVGYIDRHQMRLYYFRNYTILVNFVDGKSASEYFRTNNGMPISDPETHMILNANAPESQWRLTAGNEVVAYYDWRSDALSAYRDDHKCSLLLEALWYESWVEGAKAVAAKRDLSGF